MSILERDDRELLCLNRPVERLAELVVVPDPRTRRTHGQHTRMIGATDVSVMMTAYVTQKAAAKPCADGEH